MAIKSFKYFFLKLQDYEKYEKNKICFLSQILTEIIPFTYKLLVDLYEKEKYIYKIYLRI